MWLCQPVCIAPRGIKSPSHHHFYRWYQLFHSQSWLVYDTVLPTLFQDDPVSIATRHPFIYIHLPYATQMINIPIYDLVAFIFHSDTINIPFRYHKYTINMPHIFQTYSWWVSSPPRGIMVDGPSVIEQQEIDGAQLPGGHPVTGAPGSFTLGFFQGELMGKS